MGLAKKLELLGNLQYESANINTITPDAATHLLLQGVTGKDVKIALTDASGARKVIVLDSGAVEVLTIDSNGLVTAAGGFAGALTGNVTGDVTGNVTGDLTGGVTGNVTGDVTGNVTGAIVNAETAHDYSAGHADWTLSATEKLSATLICTNADAGANIIAPAEARRYIVRNASGQAITIKKSGGTGIAVANGKTAEVVYSATAGDYIRVTADATH
jgi:hypothetical protein